MRGPVGCTASEGGPAAGLSGIWVEAHPFQEAWSRPRPGLPPLSPAQGLGQTSHEVFFFFSLFSLKTIFLV